MLNIGNWSGKVPFLPAEIISADPVRVSRGIPVVIPDVRREQVVDVFLPFGERHLVLVPEYAHDGAP